MFGFDDHQDLGSEQVDRAVSGIIHHQLAGTQNWNGTSLRVLKSVVVSRIMDPDNFSEPLNCTDPCFSEDILNVFINPQLQKITEVDIDIDIQSQSKWILISIPGTILAGWDSNIDSLCSRNLLQPLPHHQTTFKVSVADLI